MPPLHTIPQNTADIDGESRSKVDFTNRSEKRLELADPDRQRRSASQVAIGREELTD